MEYKDIRDYYEEIVTDFNVVNHLFEVVDSISIDIIYINEIKDLELLNILEILRLKLEKLKNTIDSFRIKGE